MLVCLWWLCLLTYTLSGRNIYEFAVNDHFCFMQSFPTLISPASAYRILSNKAKVKYLTVTFTPLCGWLIMICSFIGDVSVWGTAGALHDLLSLCVETQQRHALDFEVTYRLEQLGKSLMIGFFQAQKVSFRVTQWGKQGRSVSTCLSTCTDPKLSCTWALAWSSCLDI